MSKGPLAKPKLTTEQDLKQQYRVYAIEKRTSTGHWYRQGSIRLRPGEDADQWCERLADRDKVTVRLILLHPKRVKTEPDEEE